MDGVTYDSGALIAADRNDRRMWALHAGFLALEVSPTVPTPVLAEAWRGGSRRQASLARFLALCTTEPLIEDQAKAVGTMAARAAHDDIVDVTVVEGAIRRHDAVVTSNPTHIRKIADATRARLTIETI
jgi:predicted nucleic acid-binding protein